MGSRGPIVVVLAVFICCASNAVAAGFEKNIMWSGRHAGVGGAAVSFAQGSEALYFNPAGLATDRAGGDISLNVSPTSSSFDGPFQDGVVVGSKTSITFPFGTTASYKLNNGLGVGVGAYVSGGSTAEFDDVTVSPATSVRPDYKANFQIVEVAAGVGYKIFDELKIGAAWRAGFASGDFWTGYVTTTPTTALVSAQLKDLSGENFAGFKLGAQYDAKTWGLGIAWRSELEFDLEGVVSGSQAPLPGISETALIPSDAKVTTNFPMQLVVGGHLHLVPNLWHLAAEYVYTQYSVNERLEVTGTLSGVDVPDVDLKWDDMHNIRLGMEYLGFILPVRAGYVFTTQVVPESNARPTLSSPGIAHTITLGTGHGFWQKTLMVNGAIEYSFASGSAPATAALNDPAGGDYSSQTVAVHAGMTYAF